MPTALVTGVWGVIGSNLAETLLDRGYDVHGVDNFVTGCEQNLDPLRSEGAFIFHEADIRDPDAMVDATEGVDDVFYRRSRPSASGLDPEGEGRKPR